MGIHGLMKLINEECPEAVKEHELDNFTGRKVAIDASMAMYQFLVAVRSGPTGSGAMLMNEAGEVTSHIQGMFNRTIKMMTGGIRPVYVFDGKPPNLKGGELAKRLAKRAKAEADLATAREADNGEDIDRQNKRLVKVTRQHNEDCKELLKLMGVPVLTAPCEAEAQCAELAKNGKVYATATEDMDALTFRTPKLLRRLTFSQSSKDKQPILEVDLATVLSGLGLTYEQFVDLCILCGCDYCSSIKGVGPKTALKLVKQHGSLEKIIAALQADKKQYEIPEDWLPQRVRRNEVEKEEVEVQQEESEEVDEVVPAAEVTDTAEGVQADAQEVVVPTPEEVPKEVVKEVVDMSNDEEYETVPPLYVQARSLFVECEVQPAEEVELRWTEPDEEGLKTYLVDRMGFSAERVVNSIKRLKDAQQQKSQKRMDCFFTVVPQAEGAGTKRKAPEPAKGAKGAKAAKTGGAKPGPKKR